MMAGQPSWADELEALLRARHEAGEVFTSDDAYALIPELLHTRPDARNVEARVRDALQQLKHRGRVEFLSKKGTYRLRAR